jgi:hypothetical protein
MPVKIGVECYAGYRGEEIPRSFQLGQERIQVKDVLDRWLSPDYRYFKVSGKDGTIYILRHDSQSFEWELNSFL